jgi:hypothetical protein
MILTMAFWSLQCCSICCSTIFTPCGSSAVKGSSNSQTFDLERIKLIQEQGTIFLDNDAVKSEDYPRAIFYLGHLSALSAELTCLENLKFLTALNQSVAQPLLLDALFAMLFNVLFNHFYPLWVKCSKRLV